MKARKPRDNAGSGASGWDETSRKETGQAWSLWGLKENQRTVVAGDDDATVG